MFASRTAARLALALALTLPLLVACSRPPSSPAVAHGADEPEPWAVTAWGERYELFPEVDPLIAGRVAAAHTHVTVLNGFLPLTAGRVEIVLRGADGREEVFAATTALRPGIFNVDIAPAAAGERDLLFRIDSAAGREEIPGGRIRVGTAESPGGLAGAAAAEGDVGFLKEQQWKTPFATRWSTTGSLREALRGAGTVVPRPGGDRLLTAPAAGRLEADPWPHSGLGFLHGQTIFEIVPRLDPDVSLAALESQVSAFEAELVPLASRLARLERLALVGAVATEEVEGARGEKGALEARLAGARRDFAAARGARAGRSASGDRVRVAAPFAGALATVLATSGQTVEAGEALGRFVATDRLWVEAALPPADAAGLLLGPVELALRLAGDRIVAIPPGAARLAARSPALDPTTGRVALLIELPPGLAGLVVGLPLEVELAAGALRTGIVLPAAALVDDAGSAVVYVQTSGESFERREVRVLARNGGEVLVAGIEPGERVVTLGGGAIRRSTLVGSGVGEAHVH